MRGTRGHSVFSQDAISDTFYQGMVGGLTGLFVVSIEDLDNKVDSFSMGPHPEWCDDYQAKKLRRQYDTTAE